LYRTAARTVLQRSDGAAAAEHATNVLRSLGVDTAGLVLADGSGLSRRNLVRPDQLGRLLAAMWSSPLREPFTGALPAPGEGTLRERFVKGAAHGHLRAKTGSLANVACLAGYLDREGRPPLVFAVLVNQYDEPEAAVLAAIDGFVE